MITDTPAKPRHQGFQPIYFIAVGALIMGIPTLVWVLISVVEYNNRQTATVVSEISGCNINYRTFLSRRKGIYFVDCATVEEQAKANDISIYTVTRQKQITLEYELAGHKQIASAIVPASEFDPPLIGTSVSIARMGSPKQSIRLIDEGRTWFSALMQIVGWLSLLTLMFAVALRRSPKQDGAR
ncbi:hypothetical protein [Bosea sp. 685]|uniref:hypothetical protein n=1 Tax=Bosea sp. 685 TaxID=3080057 RepID=UPI002892EAA7|nr:hypothetical protein [Bosea sp. 685]WNJ89930.1 hypothetical protein RMR04_26650 [Bosea sp. 685]